MPSYPVEFPFLSSQLRSLKQCAQGERQCAGGDGHPCRAELSWPCTPPTSMTGVLGKLSLNRAGML